MWDAAVCEKKTSGEQIYRHGQLDFLLAVRELLPIILLLRGRFCWACIHSAGRAKATGLGAQILASTACSFLQMVWACLA